MGTANLSLCLLALRIHRTSTVPLKTEFLNQQPVSFYFQDKAIFIENSGLIKLDRYLIYFALSSDQLNQRKAVDDARKSHLKE